MEIVGFARMVLDRPVLHRSDLGNDRRWIIHVKDARLLALECDEELGWVRCCRRTVLRVHVTRRGRSQVEQPGKSLALGPVVWWRAVPDAPSSSDRPSENLHQLLAADWDCRSDPL